MKNELIAQRKNHASARKYLIASLNYIDSVIENHKLVNRFSYFIAKIFHYILLCMITEEGKFEWLMVRSM